MALMLFGLAKWIISAIARIGAVFGKQEFASIRLEKRKMIGISEVTENIIAQLAKKIVPPNVKDFAKDVGISLKELKEQLALLEIYYVAKFHHAPLKNTIHKMEKFGEVVQEGGLKKFLNAKEKSKKMPRFFDTEIRELYNKKYLKVFIRDLTRINEVQAFLEGLHCTRNVNISSSTSRSSPSQNLTVYPSLVYDIEEVQREVTVALESYFAGSPVDPNFVEEGISSISETAYSQIIDYINLLGRNLERSRELRVNFDEERSRDYFLPFLNSISRRHVATGETFNGVGRTDILIQNEKGENVFIAECKIWRGQQQFTNAINQLLDRYVNWRDEKVALMIFNKTTQNFTEVIERAKEAMETHPNFQRFVSERNNTSFSYGFQHPEDENRTIKIELMLFNFT